MSTPKEKPVKTGLRPGELPHLLIEDVEIQSEIPNWIAIRQQDGSRKISCLLKAEGDGEDQRSR